MALEPTHQRWWFALDLPVEAPGARVFLTYDYQLIGAEPVNEVVSFEAISYLAARTQGTLGAGARREDTALPEELNPRTHELATQLRAGAGSDAAFVRAALEYLAATAFPTRSPPPLSVTTPSTTSCSARARASAATTPPPSSR